MRSTVAATIALILALAATTASAGVVISQDVVVTDNLGQQHKSEQTVMLQGNKQKEVAADRVIITDLDAGKVFVLIAANKTFGEVELPPVSRVAVLLARRDPYVDYKKSAGTDKVAGYDCQNYAGTTNVGRIKIDVTECVASAAAGAKEYAGFRKTLAEKLKNSPLETKGEIPDGIPVSSTVTSSFIPFPIPRGYPPEQAKKIAEADAKAKPEVKSIKVRKIEVKNLPPDTFMVPADYKKLVPANPVAGKSGALKNSGAAAASPGSH